MLPIARKPITIAKKGGFSDLGKIAFGDNDESLEEDIENNSNTKNKPKATIVTSHELFPGDLELDSQDEVLDSGRKLSSISPSRSRGDVFTMIPSKRDKPMALTPSSYSSNLANTVHFPSPITRDSKISDTDLEEGTMINNNPNQKTKPAPMRHTSHEAFNDDVFDTYDDEEILDTGKKMSSISPTMNKLDNPVVIPSVKSKPSTKETPKQTIKSEFSPSIYEFYDDENEVIIDHGRNIRSISPSMNRDSDMTVIPPQKFKDKYEEVVNKSNGKGKQTSFPTMQGSKVTLEQYFDGVKNLASGVPVNISARIATERSSEDMYDDPDHTYLDEALGDNTFREKPPLQANPSHSLPLFRRAGKGEQLSQEDALRLMSKERSEMENEKAKLRHQNDSLRDELQRRAEQSGKVRNEVTIIEKIVEVAVEDPNAAQYKDEMDQLKRRNAELQIKNQVDSRKLLQSVLAHECVGHPLASKNNITEVDNIQNTFRNKLIKDFGLDVPIEEFHLSEMKESSERKPVEEAKPTQVIKETVTKHVIETDDEKPKAKQSNSNNRSEPKPLKSSLKQPQKRSESESDSGSESESESEEETEEDDGMMAEVGGRSSRRPDRTPRTNQGQRLPALPLPNRDKDPKAKDRKLRLKKVLEEKDEDPPFTSSRQRSNSEAHGSKVPPILPYRHPALPMLIWEGGGLWKIPFNGKGPAERRTVAVKRASMPGPNARPVRILAKGEMDEDGAAAVPVAYIAYPPTLIWFNPASAGERKNARELVLNDGAYAVSGNNTPAFWKYLSRNEGGRVPRAAMCFSVVTGTRTLDLAADSEKDVYAWKQCVVALLSLLSSTKGWSGEQILRDKPSWNHEDDGLNSARKYPFNQPTSARRASVQLQDEPLYSGRQSNSAPISTRQSSSAPMTSRSEAADQLKRQLFLTAMTGDTIGFAEILETGLSVNLIDPVSTDTPLMIACRANKPDIVRICLRFGARNDPHPDFGQTALHAAISSKAFDCALEILTAAVPSGADVLITNLGDPRGQTPLHVACSIGDTRTLLLLLKHGAEITRCDNQGQTALHICAACGNKDCMAMVMDHGGDSLLEQKDGQGNTPLHAAAREGHLSCVKLLLETAADSNARNNAGQTPYNVASARGHQQISLLLLQYLEPLTSRASPRPGSARRPSSAGGSREGMTRRQQQQSSGESGSFFSDDQDGRPGFSRGSSSNSTADTTALPRPHTMSPTLRRVSSSGNSPQSPQSPGYRILRRSETNADHRGLRGGSQYPPQDSPGDHLPPIFQGMEIHPRASRSVPQYDNGNNYSNSNNGQYGNSAFGDYEGYHFQENNQYQYQTDPNYHSYYSYPDQSSGYNAAHPSQYPTSPQPSGGGNGGGGDMSPLDVMQQSYYKASYLPRTYNGYVNNNYNDSSQYYDQSSQGYENYDSYNGSNYYSSEQTTEGTAQTYTEAAPVVEPLERFHCQDVNWEAYMTEEGYTYYLDSMSGHSQWEDPRTHGISPGYGVEAYDAQDQSSASFTQPKSVKSPTKSSPPKHGTKSTPKRISSEDVSDVIANDQTSSDSFDQDVKNAIKADQEKDKKFVRPRSAANLPDPMKQKYFTGGPRQHYSSESETDDGYDLVLGPSVQDIGKRIKKKKVKKTPEKQTDDRKKESRGEAHHHTKPATATATAAVARKELPEVKNPKHPHARPSSRPRSRVPKDSDNELEISADFFSANEAGGSLEVSADDVSGDFEKMLPDAVTIEKALAALSAREDSARKSEGVALDNANRKERNGNPSDSLAKADSKPNNSNVHDVDTKALVKNKLFNPNEDGSYGVGGNSMRRAPQKDEEKERKISGSEKEPGNSDGKKEPIDRIIEKYVKRYNEGLPVSSIRSLVEKDGHAQEVRDQIIQIIEKLSGEKEISDKKSNDMKEEKSGAQQDDKATQARIQKYVEKLKNGVSIRVLRREMEEANESQELILKVVRVADDLEIQPTASTDSAKMSVSNSDSETKPSKSGSKESLEALKADAILGKYAKMAGVGVPPSNVKQRMQLDHISAKDISRLMRALGAEKEDEAPAAAPSSTSEADLEALRGDPVLGKYVRMITVGVPTANVVHKMQVENVSPEAISRLLSAVNGDAPSDVPRPKTASIVRGRSESNSDQRPNTSAAPSKLQKIHWDALPAEKLRKSVWKANDDENDISHDHDMDELEELFGSREAARPRSLSRTGSQKEDPNNQLYVIDPKRAQNLIIGLAQFKSFGGHLNLLVAICSYDKTDVLDSEKVENFKVLLPNVTELAKLKNERLRPTHPAEQFLKCTIDFYPELPVRLNTFLSCEHFGNEYNSAVQKANLLIDACNQVISSDKLARILQKMLAVGNIMNQGTHRGEAEGITLDSLLKMVQTKGVDKKTSVLDYVVKKILTKGDERLLNASDDISLSDEASRLSGSDLVRGLDTLLHTVSTIDKELSRVKSRDPNSTSAPGVTVEVNNMYISKLDMFLTNSNPRMDEIKRLKGLMTRKSTEVVEYFGEDAGSCDTGKIFVVLMEFRRALVASKAMALRKLKTSGNA